MGYLIIKEAPETDFYVEWCTDTDTPTFGGTRVEMIDFLYEVSDYKPDRHPCGAFPEDRVARADATGTSVRHTVRGFPRKGSWQDEPFRCTLPVGWVLAPRAVVGEVARRVLTDPENPDLSGLGLSCDYDRGDA